MAAEKIIEIKSAEAMASNYHATKDERAFDDRRTTKNVQGRTEVTLIPCPSDSPRDPLVCNEMFFF